MAKLDLRAEFPELDREYSEWDKIITVARSQAVRSAATYRKKLAGRVLNSDDPNLDQTITSLTEIVVASQDKVIASLGAFGCKVGDINLAIGIAADELQLSEAGTESYDD